MAMTNIGALIEPVKIRHPAKPCVPVDDCFVPQADTNLRIARNPGTVYKQRCLQYNQRKAEYAEKFKNDMRKDLLDEMGKAAFFRSSENRFYYKQLHSRVKEKIEKVRSSIPVRREKLKKLSIEERKQNFMETIAQAQQANHNIVEGMRQRLAEMREKRAKETEAFVKEKRLLQLFDKCDAFRTYFADENLIASKRYQLLQIEERKKRKEAEKKIDQMWHDLTMKAAEAMKQKELHEATVRKIKELEDIEIRNKQIEGRKVLVNELNRSRHIEKLELEKSLKQMEEELAQAKKLKQQKMEEMRRVLKEQVEEKKAIYRREAEQERIIDVAYGKLLEQTLAAEKSHAINRKVELRFETDMFKSYQNQIKEAQRRDEAALDRLVQCDRMKLDAIKAEEQQRLCEYRQELARQLHEDRQLILETRQARAAKEKEDMLLYDKSVQRMNDLDNEVERQHQAKLFEEQKRYYADLKEQHNYKLLQEQRKREEDAEIERSARKTEKEIDQIMKHFQTGDIPIQKVRHPFAGFIHADCHCSKPSK